MSADPYPARTPCLFEGCTSSAEEHHRVNRGLVAEAAGLRARLKAPEVVDLADVSDEDLLAEVARRLVGVPPR